MKLFRKFLYSILLLCVSISINAQCNHTLSINSLTAECNINGISTVTINVTILFGNGNNSATISYNMGSGNVVMVIIEDDFGDVIEQTYVFDVPTCNDYSIILEGWTNPAGSGSSCTSPEPVSFPVALPVTFGDFDIAQRNEKVSIEWSTYSETNNDKFVIQKTKDLGRFATIGEIDGSGNSLQKINYQFFDEDIDRGTYYYRIKQIDLDGKFSYSDVKSITIKMDTKLAVYPNPAKDYISINSFTDLLYRIFDTNGNLVHSGQLIGDEVRIDISKLNKGLYFLWSSDSSEKLHFLKM